MYSLGSVAALSALSTFVTTLVSAIPLEDSASDQIANIVERASVPTVTPTPVFNLPNKAPGFSGSLLTGSVVAGSTLNPGQPIPSGVYNPNGPIFNPNDYTPPPFTWPGRPTDRNQSPPPRPTKAPFPTGGRNATKYQIPAWVQKGLRSLPAGLPQSVTNGNSPWGLLNCPRLNGTVKGNPCSNTIPDTGVTKTYDFTVSYQEIAPDGVVKNGLVINGGFPGPLIEANWGDWIEVTVHNNLPDEGTALHWHGLLQNGTPFFDGVPSVSQCPIAPGETLVYRFRADLYGTTWYHSHYSAQYAGGALGPIVIHGPKTADYDIDLGPIMLSDWYHADYYTLVEDTMNGLVPVSNNNLINGKMNYPCENTTNACTPNAGISKFQFQSGKKYRLRLINTSAEGVEKFSIDGHNFTVIANDFIPVQPYTTNLITLGVGQRSDVIVQATGSSGEAYWMRADLGNLGAGCSVTDGVSPQGVAAVYYQNANTSTIPTTSSTITPAQIADCGNDPLLTTVAFCPVTPDPLPPTTETINIRFGSNGTHFVWFMNNSSFRGNYNQPVVLNVHNGNLTFDPQWNVHNFGTNSSVRLIVENTFRFGAHPMHLHGHNYHVLAEGFGTWDGVVTNPANTQRRDVQLVRPAQDDNTPAFIVLQWTQDNPAVWPFHCHIAWHVSGGLYINVLERPQDIQAMPFSDTVASTCASWDLWTQTNFVNQIDSGLRIRL